MNDCRPLNHSKWHCEYRVVFIPKCRKKVLYRELRKELGKHFQTLAEHEESTAEDGHLMPDHVHMLLSAAACLG
mgnify:CR=1 FL=1